MMETNRVLISQERGHRRLAWKAGPLSSGAGWWGCVLFSWKGWFLPPGPTAWPGVWLGRGHRGSGQEGDRPKRVLGLLKADEGIVNCSYFLLPFGMEWFSQGSFSLGEEKEPFYGKKE